MKINRSYNHTEETIGKLYKGKAFIDPITFDAMMITDMPTGHENTVFAVSLRWGSMKEYNNNEIVWACDAKVNINME